MSNSHRSVAAIMLRVLALAALIGLAGQLQAAPNEAKPAAYRLGIFPYMAPRQTVELFGPAAASMEAALKHPVRLESTASFKEFTRATAAGRYDIALIQPFDYPQMVDDLGYLPLAKMSIPLIAQLVVRDDSRYRKLEDLRGTTVALPPAESANARMTLRSLHANKLIPGRDVQVNYFNSHDSCLQQVWIGDASACGTSSAPILVFETRMQAKLRPIFDTPAIPHSLFVAHPRVPAEHRARLQELIIGWSQSEEGRTLLKNLGIPGFVAPKPAEYAMMRNFDPAAVIAKAAPVATRDLLLGVFPYLPIRQIAQNFAPALPALRKSAGAPVHLRTAANFRSFSMPWRRDTTLWWCSPSVCQSRRAWLSAAEHEKSTAGQFLRAR